MASLVAVTGFTKIVSSLWSKLLHWNTSKPDLKPLSVLSMCPY